MHLVDIFRPGHPFAHVIIQACYLITLDTSAPIPALSNPSARLVSPVSHFDQNPWVPLLQARPFGPARCKGTKHHL